MIGTSGSISCQMILTINMRIDNSAPPTVLMTGRSESPNWRSVCGEKIPASAIAPSKIAPITPTNVPIQCRLN